MSGRDERGLAASPVRKSRLSGAQHEAPSKTVSLIPKEEIFGVEVAEGVAGMPEMSTEDEATLHDFIAVVEENTKGKSLHQCLSLSKLAELAGIDLNTVHRDSTLSIALWVSWLQIIERHTSPSELKYRELDEFVTAYPAFADKSEPEKRVLMRTANWMHFLFSTIPAKKNKGLALLVVPKLVEGWQARYITGSGQTKPTADRVYIYELEGGVQALGKPRSVGRGRKTKKDANTSTSKRKQGLFSTGTTEKKSNEQNNDRAVEPSQPQTLEDSLGVFSKRVKAAHVPLYDIFSMPVPDPSTSAVKRGRDACLTDFLSELDLFYDCSASQEIVDCDGIRVGVDVSTSAGDDGHFYENDTSSESAGEDDLQPFSDVSETPADGTGFVEPVKKKMKPTPNNSYHDAKSYVSQRRPVVDVGTGVGTGAHFYSVPAPLLAEPFETRPSFHSLSMTTLNHTNKEIIPKSTAGSSPLSAITNPAQDPVSVDSPVPSPITLSRMCSWEHDLNLNPSPLPHMDVGRNVGAEGEYLDVWQVPGFPSGTTNMLFPSELSDEADPFQFFL